MPELKKRNISTVGDTSFTKLKLTKPPEYAAGLTALQTTVAHLNKESGVFKSLATLGKMNQKDGFDCPGCAWPDPEEPSKLGEYCENGAKAIAEETTFERANADFFATYSVEKMSQWTDMQIGKSGRLTEPMVLRPDSVNYEPISWEDAFGLVAQQLHQLDSPDQAIFYTSGRSSNEAAFLYGLFVRAFGTNNMPDCSNMCHESSGVALTETLGIGKGSVTLDDLYEAEVVMVIGQNPGTNHPRMLSALEKCKKNGGKIITVNPLEEAGLVRFKNPQKINGILGSGTSLTDVFLQVKINEDVALLKLIMKRLLAMERGGSKVFDTEFIASKTAGYQELQADLDRYDEMELLERCGVPSDIIDLAVSILAERKRIIICWAMGLTQHKNGVDNIRECVNLLLLKGSIGKRGAGTCPVRGHSNVQGDRSVGIMHHVSKPLNQALKKVFGFDAPEKEGLDTVGCVKAMYRGDAKIFVALGGNFVSAVSDTNYTAQALQNCDLTVSIATKLNRGHLITGKTALILPTLGRTERDAYNSKTRFVTVENSMGKVHQSQGGRNPISEYLKSEPSIVAGLANAYFKGNSSVDWLALGADYGLIREKISQVYEGYEDYTKRSKGSGFYLPNNARVGDFSKLPGGKAQFSINQLASHRLAEDEFVLMTIRSHDQFNTTIYDLNDRYRGIYGERRIVFMNPNDIKDKGYEKLQVVNLTSYYQGKLRRAVQFKIVPYNIPKGNLAAYFPETNVLVPIDEFATKSNTPISKSIVVKIEV
ncbi:Putative formate dehydrogenase oxidoreductase protein [Croceitalea dokdonensis DOKDO 023]|uniref:Putative formate dehydrogenase oxidoreductase protein n=1 Tax=Croceitalea dokdonensis DOKDO 023 TaxID=1300341 RepID=A0A0P7AF17_9FLAO|nr:FdhF/YdeP family oxidoreductase [Croceitalea dokdonensis]KPM31849.1 Putative formate dehydrogenase oxidoreductase protein [Croceitalea dokdonensis DOKDO 023]